VYNNLSDKYDIPLFKENLDPLTRIPHWYTNQRFRLSVNIKKRVIENGDKIQPNKSPPCGRELLKSIAKAHLQINTVDSIEHRAENVCAWLSCGRTAEVALATYNLATWNLDEDALHTDWSMEKVAAQKML
jgi:hypothetical protein